MFGRIKVTNYRAGGLLPTRCVRNRNNTYVPAKQFVAPRKIDCRDMCLETSDQAITPRCAGYACAGYIEVQNWKQLHYPEQVDADKIYLEAKRIDNDNIDGTTLDSVATAAINLGLIQGRLKFIDAGVDNIKFAIHLKSVCMIGLNITNEWNNVNKKSGEISDFGDKAEPLGGHAVLACGYDNKGLYIQNSWGVNWALYGFALVPWKLVLRQYMYGLVIA